MVMSSGVLCQKHVPYLSRITPCNVDLLCKGNYVYPRSPVRIFASDYNLQAVIFYKCSGILGRSFTIYLKYTYNKIYDCYPHMIIIDQ